MPIVIGMDSTSKALKFSTNWCTMYNYRCIIKNVNERLRPLFQNKTKGEIKMELGQTVMTRGVGNAVVDNFMFYQFVFGSLERYKNHDWGDLPREDKRMNDLAIKTNNDRIVARYNNDEGDIYIITEWDRSYTTILFVNEY